MWSYAQCSLCRNDQHQLLQMDIYHMCLLTGYSCLLSGSLNFKILLQLSPLAFAYVSSVLDFQNFEIIRVSKMFFNITNKRLP